MKIINKMEAMTEQRKYEEHNLKSCLLCIL